MIQFAEAREKLPYREKFARYYAHKDKIKNMALLQQQGWLTSLKDNP